MPSLRHIEARSQLLLRPGAAVGRDWVKLSIWLYFILLIFEGSLRKWVLPQLAGPILIVRDPVVVMIYILAVARGDFPRTGKIAALVVIAALSLFCTLVAGRGTLAVTAFGLRTNFLHLPLIFVIGSALTKEDVILFGRAFLTLSPLVSGLMILQFLSAPDAYLNKGTSGGEIGQIESAMGRIRPAALFSYNTGAGQFLSLAAAFVLFALMTRRLPQWLFYMAGVSIIMALAVSGSRTSVSSVIIVALMLIPIWLVLPRYWSRFGAVAVAIVLITMIVAHSGVFRLGVEVLSARVENAAGTEGGFEGFIKRAMNDFGISAVIAAPFLGFGLGVGTNVGSKILTGELLFLLAEGEWSRVILEMGPVLGLAYLSWRVATAWQIGTTAWGCLRRGEILPILLFGATALLLLNGQFGQATTLGFSVFGAGLCLAATNLQDQEVTMDPEEPVLAQADTQRRGRSEYAERLHRKG